MQIDSGSVVKAKGDGMLDEVLLKRPRNKILNGEEHGVSVGLALAPAVLARSASQAAAGRDAHMGDDTTTRCHTFLHGLGYCMLFDRSLLFRRHGGTFGNASSSNYIGHH